MNRNLFFMIFGDLVLILSALYLSILIRFDFFIPIEVNSLLNFQNLSLIVITKIFCFRLFSLYRGMWRYTSIWDMFNIIKANILATICLIFLISYYRGFENISRSLFLIDLILSSGFICTSRIGIRIFFTQVVTFLNPNASRKNKRKILLIGAGDTGQSILRQTLQKSTSPIDIVGFLDDDIKKIGRKLHGVSIIASVNNILNIKILYDEIYICVPSASRREMQNIIRECEKTNKPFKTLPSLSELIEGKVSLSQFRDVSILDLLGREEVNLDKSAIKNLVNGKRLLVTGAGGSIGSELVRQCLIYNPSVLIMIDISELNLFEIERELKKRSSKILFKPILCDIRDSNAIEKIFEEFKPQIVFHAAAYKHVPIQENFPWEAVKTNIFGTFNLSKSSIINDVEKFVLVSTDKAVKPVNVMGATKRIAEIIMQDSNYAHKKTAFMAVRFGNVLGSSGSVIPVFKEQIKEGGPVTVTDPAMERYFMSIPEASQLILQAGSIGFGGEVFILDMGNPIKIIDLASDLIRLSGYDLKDIPIKITGVRPGEKKTEELSNPTENLDKTEHGKIFVLRNSEDDTKNNSDIISKIKNFEEELNDRNPEKIRTLLSSILKEYKPSEFLNEDSFLKNNKAEA